MDAFQQSSTVFTFKAHQESGIRKVVSRRYSSLMNFRMVRGNDSLRSLVIPPGYARRSWRTPIDRCVTGSRSVQFSRSIPKSCGHKPDDAGLARLFPGISLIETAGGSPGLHGTHQAKKQGGHGLVLLYGRNGFVEKIFQSWRTHPNPFTSAPTRLRTKTFSSPP